MKVPTFLAASVLVLAGCSIGSAGPYHPSGARATTPGVAITGAGRASCRVPFVSSDSTGVTAYWMAQDGTVSEDPTGRFGRRSDNFYQSATTPVLVGPNPLYYDSALHRWLPAGRESVSPDGSQYAYVKPFTTTVQVVTVATGQESSYLVPRGPWHILDFTAEGLYLNQEWEGVGAGLWRLDLRTTQLRKVLSDPTVTFVTDETAWVWDVDPSAPASFSAFAGANMPNRISRLDLRSGVLTNWVTTADAVPNVIGFDLNGRPFIVANGQQESAVELVPAPNQVVNVTTYRVGPGGPVFQPHTAIADESGEWLGGPDGLYRYDASGFHRVAATGKATDPANRCV